jgi:cysteine synthase A
MTSLSLLELLSEGASLAIGNTPLVSLQRIPRTPGLQVFAKLEGSNPWGSIKDRTAFHILRDAIVDGHVGPDTLIVESTSGNLGLGLAHICNYLNLRFVCVVDQRASKSILNIISLLGAQIVMVDSPAANSDTLLKARLDTVRRICDESEDAYWPNQYANRSNPAAHLETMREIFEQLEGAPDFLFVPVSTCGTLRGCVEYIRSHGLQTSVVAVDAVGSSITGNSPGKRLLPGHGAGILPAHYNSELASHHIHISDAESVEGCRRLLRFESLMTGASSGAAIMAFDKMMTKIPHGSTCVLILPDRGERYLDTVYSDSWVRENLDMSTVKTILPAGSLAFGPKEMLVPQV